MKCISGKVCNALLGLSRLHVGMSAKGMSGKAAPSSINDEDVLFESVGNKGVITLNRPKALNALTMSMIRTIYSKLLEWQSTMSFVVVRSNSGKAFCAGGDVVAVTEAAKKGDSLSTDFFHEEYNMNYLIATYKVPQVSLIHGITMGGGIGLSFYGKYRVATEMTLIAMPETLIGLIPDIGGTYFLPRMPKNLGIFLGLTGQRLVGYDVVRAGIATHFCDVDKLGDLQKELLALNDSSGLDALFRKYTEGSTHAKSGVSNLVPNMDKIEHVFSHKTIEGIIAALDKDGSEWASRQREALLKVSPTSLKLTMRMFRMSHDHDLKDALSNEFNVIQNILKNKDYYEGVRALLVDKDNSPSWNPSRVEDVMDSDVDSYFKRAARELKL